MNYVIECHHNYLEQLELRPIGVMSSEGVTRDVTCEIFKSNKWENKL